MSFARRFSEVSAARGRARVALVCMECGSRNYKKTKSKEPGTAALSLKKFCKSCGRHTQHLEAQ